MRAAVCLAILLAPAAFAQPSPVAGLQCRGEDVLVRFGQVEADPSDETRWFDLPEALASAWRPQPGPAAPGRDGEAACRLASGRQVVMRVRYGPMAGWDADQPAAVSVWIDRRKVISRELFHPTRRTPGPPMNSILVTPGRIERCIYFRPGEEEFDPDPSHVVCTLSPFDLARLTPDPLETGAPREAVTIAASPSLAFCRRFPQTGDALLPPEAASVAFTRTTPGDTVSWIETARADLDNDGWPDTLVRVNRLTPGLEQTLWWRDGEASAAQLDLLLRFVGQAVGPTPSQGEALAVWSLVADAEGRAIPSVSDVFTLSGAAFIFGGSAAEHTDSVVYKAYPRTGFETVCTFRSPQPNF